MTDRVRNGRIHQPVHRVEWIAPTALRANNYNPNHVFPPELALLKTSMLLSGWTQPIVARQDGEIIDGFHRWTLGSTDPEVAALGGGLVPVVWARGDLTEAEQMMATIRHNRARGEHNVLKMAEIVVTLIDRQGLTPAEVSTLLSMEEEEVDRLYDRSGMTQRGAQDDTFSTAWSPA